MMEIITAIMAHTQVIISNKSSSQSHYEYKDKTVSVTSVSISRSSISLTVGESANLSASAYPGNATDKSITWSSTNNSIASVSNGRVSAKSAGTCTIAAGTNPTKFKNVTNGIAYRRWLYQSNEGLTDLLCEKIGDGFLKNAAELSKLAVFKDDKDVLDRLAKIKLDNKKSLQSM